MRDVDEAYLSETIPQNGLISPIVRDGFSTAQIGIVSFDAYEMASMLVMSRFERTDVRLLLKIMRLTDALRAVAQENKGWDQFVRGFI